MIPNLMKLGHEIDDPPQVFYLLREYAKDNYEQPIKTTELAKYCRACFFDFEYPLEVESKEKFECMVINHFLMRRIGYETLTSFKIALCVKLNEIMPTINKLFVSLEGWDLFNDGEMVIRDVNDDRVTVNKSTNTQSVDGSQKSIDTKTSNNEQTFSDTPENQMDQIRNGEYASEFTVNKNEDNLNSDVTTKNKTDSEINSNVDDKNKIHETISRSPVNKMEIYTSFLQNRQNIYTIIFKELEPLFYQLVD